VQARCEASPFRHRPVVRADSVADRDVNSVARDVRMVSIQAVHNGRQACRAVGAPRDKSPRLATWMDECSTARYTVWTTPLRQLRRHKDVAQAASA
jgi:hypothetical protein